MNGLEPEGAPFTALINHDVDIEPQAESLHGYSRVFLCKNGKPPREVYSQFREYVGDRPIVAYNLSFDWGRVLEPEYDRLSIPPIGRPAFCALTLARRSVNETASHKLEVLRQFFFPGEPNSAHRASTDLETTVRLFQTIIWPRLEKAGVLTFSEVIEFSCKTPVAACLEHLGLSGGKLPAPKFERPSGRIDPLSELVGLISGILSDEVVVDAEIWALRRWFDNHRLDLPVQMEPLRKLVREIISDGFVTDDERSALTRILKMLTGSSLAGKKFVFTGTLTLMTRSEAFQKVLTAGGQVSETVTAKGTDFLVAGIDAGSKLRKANELGVSIISEGDFISMLENK